MASPFSIFRKNQKLMLAALTILAMFGFVFLPIFMDQMSSTKAQNPVAVETSKYGDLREREIGTLMEKHRRVLATLTELMQMAGASPSLAGRILEGSLGPASMENVVNNWLLARYAEQMGMVTSNQTVNGWLKMITQDTVNAANFQAAFKHHGLSEFQFFELMHDELAALQLKNMFESSLVALTPAQRWEYFRRLKQTAMIEAVPLAVANYLNRIDEPGDEELKAFFEQYKDRYALPESPEPGFRDPQRIALQYFKANVDKFAAGVTEDEIKAHYEKNKTFYDQLEKRAESKESKKTEEPSTKKEPSTTNTKDTKPAAQPAKQQAAKEAKEAKQPASATGPTSATPLPSRRTPSAKQPETGKQPGPSPQPEKGKKPKGTSAVERPSPFVLTALLKDEKPAPASATGPASATPSPSATGSASATPAGSASASQPKPPETKPGLSEARTRECHWLSQCHPRAQPCHPCWLSQCRPAQAAGDQARPVGSHQEPHPRGSGQGEDRQGF